MTFSRAAVAAVGVLVLSACSSAAPEPAPQPSTAGSFAAELAVHIDLGDGSSVSGRLSCPKGVYTDAGFELADANTLIEGEGFFDDNELAERGCRELAARPQMLEPAQTGQPCTQVFGGSATAHVTGTVNDRPVERTFDRRDGCGIADWDAAAALFAAVKLPAAEQGPEEPVQPSSEPTATVDNGGRTGSGGSGGTGADLITPTG